MVYNYLKNMLEGRRLHKVTILSVEDDKGLQGVIQHYMEEDGHTVLTANSGKDLRELLAKSPSIDIILMDLTLPDAEGMSLIPVIRASTNVPIIIVSGKTDSTEKIVGLEMGADDYITKPFEMRELAARIKAVIRRSSDHAPVATPAAVKNDATKLVFDGWTLDRDRYQLYSPANESAALTTGEFKLLEALLMSPNRVMTREHLFDLTREDSKYDVYDRAIDIQIARIRKKINDDPKHPALIKTVRGVGYMFCGKVEAA